MKQKISKLTLFQKNEFEVYSTKSLYGLKDFIMIKFTEYPNINTSEIEIAGKSYYYDNSLYNNGQTLAWSIRNNEPDTIKSIEHVFDLCEQVFKVGISLFCQSKFYLYPR